MSRLADAALPCTVRRVWSLGERSHCTFFLAYLERKNGCPHEETNLVADNVLGLKGIVSIAGRRIVV